MDLQAYTPVLLFLLVGGAVAVLAQLAGGVLGPHRPDPAKNSPYECGFEHFSDARHQMNVRYYLVAILFLLFDLEIAFLLPWALVSKEVGLVGFSAAMMFLAVLTVGLVYEWRKGALEWE